ncbi:rhomboid family intramembrane serine protease [Rhodococcus sp. 06-1460-1B]|uniref:rhomboid family intramembrane serine protease n=1 Tax=Rhodococcus sp. 06-1460-1B TaxID=2022501 RepID=UPI000B9BC2A9|nr:rhomboid family intramembrane serine protease [Rhodococcus sp. 06-1460-1B]OZD56853.1 rhomboid family intramembrane serine protease [Rhodococcus sp. 06-1460-1B]
MTNPGWGGAYGDQPNPPQSVCVRHPDRPTGLACSRCGRPACPQCLQPAAVGQHCVDCVRDGNKNVRTARTVAGAPMTRSTKTPLTFALIAINVVIFGITAAQSGDLLSNFRGSSLADAWALNSLLVADGDVWRLLSSGFIHIGPIHLLVNMFALYIIGRDVELVLGRSRYLAVYFLSLLGGSASVLLFENPVAATAGASGAVFGLLGAQAVILLRLKRSPTPVLIVIALNIFISISIPSISLWGHMGGLVAGAAATAGLVFLPNRNGAQPRAGISLAWLSVAAVALIALGTIAVRVLDLRAQMGF